MQPSPSPHVYTHKDTWIPSCSADKAHLERIPQYEQLAWQQSTNIFSSIWHFSFKNKRAVITIIRHQWLPDYGILLSHVMKITFVSTDHILHVRAVIQTTGLVNTRFVNPKHGKLFCSRNRANFNSYSSK